MVLTVSCLRESQVGRSRLKPAPSRPVLTWSKKIGRGGSAGSVILLGQVGPRSTMYQALVVQHAMGHSGNLLMDAPPHNCIDELRHIANDRCRWKALARSLN